MQTQSPATAREVPPPIDGEEFAAGLMLVRASTLKIIRLQLALERQDRRVALEEVDDLLAIDRHLQAYLAASDSGLCQEQLNAERLLLNREKLTLAAGVLRRAPEPEVEEAGPAVEDWLGPADFALEFEEPRRRRWGWLAFAFLLIAIVALAIYFIGWAEAADRLSALTGAPR